MVIRIGTAGWSIPRALASEFPADGSSLQRYAAKFAATEINSSFYRVHRRETWERWHDSVPDNFRFSVKLPKEITHTRKLLDCEEQLNEFGHQVKPLRDKLGVVLVQLPPKLAFDSAVADNFFSKLKMRVHAAVVCEPRHISWFSEVVNDLLESLDVARVAADPALSPAAAAPGGSTAIRYWRLHGSPVVYRSSYRERLKSYAELLRSASTMSAQAWCVFDNTASSAATADALALLQLEGRSNDVRSE